MKQMVGIFLLLYAFALFQMSFLVHFFPSGWIPNVLIFAVVFLSIFERHESYASFAAALFGGFFMDIFSGGIIGFWPLVLLLFSALTRFVLENYVRFPIPKQF